jgi:hypothetical protein
LPRIKMPSMYSSNCASRPIVAPVLPVVLVLLVAA